MTGVVINTTFFIPEGKERGLKTWLRDRFIPAAMAAGFTAPHFMQVTTNVQPGMAVFALHLSHDSADAADSWLHGEGASVIGAEAELHGEDFLWIHSTLIPLDEEVL